MKTTENNSEKSINNLKHESVKGEKIVGGASYNADGSEIPDVTTEYAPDGSEIQVFHAPSAGDGTDAGSMPGDIGGITTDLII